jgi:hypothetical protein
MIASQATFAYTKKVRTPRILLATGTLLLIISGFFYAPTFAHAQSSYSSGNYGSCTYNSCGITFGADASADVSVLVGGGTTTCTTARAEIQVATDSTTGYSLMMTDNDTDTSMEDGVGDSIPTTSGTNASPTALSTNTWGYRVDGNGGFGAGPTTAASNTGIPSGTYAAIPSSSATPDIITYSTVPANPYTSTFVFFGLCADTTPPLGTYSDSVVYTAVVN